MACPICRKSTVPEHRPFCSRRCADIDLARWIGGEYAIRVPSEDGEPAPRDEGET